VPVPETSASVQQRGLLGKAGGLPGKVLLCSCTMGFVQATSVSVSARGLAAGTPPQDELLAALRESEESSLEKGYHSKAREQGPGTRAGVAPRDDRRPFGCFVISRWICRLYNQGEGTLRGGQTVKPRTREHLNNNM